VFRQVYFGGSLAINLLLKEFSNKIVAKILPECKNLQACHSEAGSNNYSQIAAGVNLV
jgi:hypothetical protein